MKKNTDLYGGLFMTIVPLFFLRSLGKMTMYSKIFPRAIITILIVLGIALLIKSKVNGSLSELFVLDDSKNVILVALVTLAWVLLFKKVGFVVTSFVALTTLLCILGEKQNIRAYVKSSIIAGVQVGVLYLIFSKILYVPFPTGLFF